MAGDSYEHLDIVHPEKTTFRKVAFMFNPHPDIAPLLWYGDGPLKNWDYPDYPNEPPNLGGHTHEVAHAVFDLDGGRQMIWEFHDKTREPSAIFSALPVHKEEDVPPVPGAPRWYRLTPGQRWNYLRYLENPYRSVEIGYAFMLYYGLERPRYFGDYTAAVPVIFRMRGILDHPSFWYYSSNALLISAYQRGDRETMRRVLDDYSRRKGDFNLCVLAHTAAGKPLSPHELIMYRSKFGFRNTRYLYAQPEAFEQELAEYLQCKYGVDGLPLCGSLDDLPQGYVPAAANWTMFGRWCFLPDFTRDAAYIAAGRSALQAAHNRIKKLSKPS